MAPSLETAINIGMLVHNLGPVLGALADDPDNPYVRLAHDRTETLASLGGHQWLEHLGDQIYNKDILRALRRTLHPKDTLVDLEKTYWLCCCNVFQALLGQSLRRFLHIDESLCALPSPCTKKDGKPLADVLEAVFGALGLKERAELAKLNSELARLVVGRLRWYFGNAWHEVHTLSLHGPRSPRSTLSSPSSAAARSPPAEDLRIRNTLCELCDMLAHEDVVIGATIHLRPRWRRCRNKRGEHGRCPICTPVTCGNSRVATESRDDFLGLHRSSVYDCRLASLCWPLSRLGAKDLDRLRAVERGGGTNCEINRSTGKACGGCGNCIRQDFYIDAYTGRALLTTEAITIRLKHGSPGLLTGLRYSVTCSKNLAELALHYGLCEYCRPKFSPPPGHVESWPQEDIAEAARIFSAFLERAASSSSLGEDAVCQFCKHLFSQVLVDQALDMMTRRLPALRRYVETHNPSHPIPISYAGALAKKLEVIHVNENGRKELKRARDEVEEDMALKRRKRS